MMWQVDIRKQGTEIFVSCEDYSIFIGDGFSEEERKRSLKYALIIANALNSEDNNE